MTTDTLVLETIAAAANPEHPWDRAALDWPLDERSVVVEVGGYKGRWALQIAERYHPRLYVFEPQPWAAEVCREVLGKRATVVELAVGARDCLVAMDKWETDGCTFMGAAGNSPQVRMREMGHLFAGLGLTHIDLMLMNIEGYEYTLIPHMIEQGILPERLMVQFHTFADPHADGKTHIVIGQALVMLGYRIAWTYGVVLTAWERS